MNIVIVDDDNTDAMHTETMVNNFFTELKQERLSISTSGMPEDSKDQEIHYRIDRYTNGEDFLHEYSSNTDMIFLDIEMPGMLGMEVAQTLRTVDAHVPVTFTTRLAQYAAQGYDVDAVGYLVKPFSQQAFDIKMRKMFTIATRRKSRSLLVAAEGKVQRIDIREILYIEVNRHEVTYHCSTFEVTSWSSLKDVIAMLERENLLSSFSQANRYSIINLDHVSAVQGENVFVGKRSITLSRGRRKQFMMDLAHYFGS
ncbi:response regulator [Alloscardovia theropitheci]|uniref:Response regulator n=1 Tax=Alloscardovia theropitheci TaxID=2496842 RepID=A0A4R0QUS7_9BIFI|nr:LytR domain-containing response regulator [Alloscardovia theropitheci]TCD53807.1 response regulator [Alloscardovia theropitheci]